MFETRQHDARGLAARVEVTLDLDDRRNGFARLAEELEAHGAHVLRGAVQEPARRGDDAIAPLLLHARQAAEKLVGDILAETRFAKLRAVDGEHLSAQNLGLVRRGAAVFPDELEARGRGVVDSAEVVTEARHLEPVSFRIDHAPAGEIVDRRAPQHRFLAAGIHRNVAADAARVGRCRIDREYEAVALGKFADASGDDAGLGEHDRAFDLRARQSEPFDGTQAFELLGIDHRAPGRERHGTPGVPRAAAARDHVEAELDALAHQMRNLRLGIRGEHHERQLDPPVGRVGDVSNPRIGVEADIVGARVLEERPPRTLAQRDHLRKVGGESIHGGARGRQQLRDFRRAALLAGIAALFDFVQPVVQGVDELGAALRIVDQIVLQEGVPVHHPDVAQHFVEHARRSAGAPLRAQLDQQLPGGLAEQPDGDLAIGERGVVVRNLAQPRRRAVGRGPKFGN